MLTCFLLAYIICLRLHRCAQVDELQVWYLCLLRLHLIQVPGQRLMQIHFAETLRALGLLGGGIFADDGQRSAQPWSLYQKIILSFFNSEVPAEVSA